MATLNPLEQKARSSFIKGFVIALLIGIAASAFLGLQLYKKIGEENQRLSAQKSVVVINQDVSSGQLLTEDMFKTIKVDPDMAQSSAVNAYNKLQAYFLSDKNGNRIDTTIDKNGNTTLTITIAAESSQSNGGKYEVQIDDNGNYFYTDLNGETKYIELADTALIAKIDLSKNTVISASMIGESNEKTTDDLREQEYNMLVLPSDLATDDIVDIRLRLPSGVDYIVLSKKRVRLLGSDSGTISNYPNTIVIKETEGELLTMSAAIVDAYKIKGCKLYAIKYIDPGIQDQAQQTYVPSYETEKLVKSFKEKANFIIRYYKLPHRGKADTWKCIYDLSEGQYILSIDSDDALYDRNSLGMMQEKILSLNPNDNFWGVCGSYVDQNGRVFPNLDFDYFDITKL